MDGGLRLLPIIFILFVTPSRAAEPAPSPSWLRLIEPLPCSAALARQLVAWRVTDEVFHGPAGIDGRSVFRVATARLGSWVTLVPDPGARPGTRLFRTDGEGSIAVTLDESCHPLARSVDAPGPVEEAASFTDRDLEELLSKHESSLIYLWSPHLPLSVEGYGQAERAAGRRGLGFAAVVHPAADRGFVEAAADRAGIPEAARRRLASVELLFRDLAVHAPAVIVFVAGRARSPLPGYRSEAGYLKYLDTVLAEPPARPREASPIE